MCVHRTLRTYKLCAFFEVKNQEHRVSCLCSQKDLLEYAHGHFSKSCEPSSKSLLWVPKHECLSIMEKRSGQVLVYIYQTLLYFIHHHFTFYLYLKIFPKELTQPPMVVSRLLNCPLVPCHEINFKKPSKDVMRKTSLALKLP